MCLFRRHFHCPKYDVQSSILYRLKGCFFANFIADLLQLKKTPEEGCDILSYIRQAKFQSIFPYFWLSVQGHVEKFEIR